MLCSLCPNTTDGCQGDCRYDKVHELCYRKGNNYFNHRYSGVLLGRILRLVINSNELSFIELHFDGMTGAHLFSFEKKWKLWNDCLEGSFVSGFRVAYHPMMGLDGFDVTCTTKHGSEYDWLVHHSVNAS